MYKLSLSRKVLVCARSVICALAIYITVESTRFVMGNWNPVSGPIINSADVSERVVRFFVRAKLTASSAGKKQRPMRWRMSPDIRKPSRFLTARGQVDKNIARKCYSVHISDICRSKFSMSLNTRGKKGKQRACFSPQRPLWYSRKIAHLFPRSKTFRELVGCMYPRTPVQSTCTPTQTLLFTLNLARDLSTIQLSRGICGISWRKSMCFVARWKVSTQIHKLIKCTCANSISDPGKYSH